jgi:hypothetical protein
MRFKNYIELNKVGKEQKYNYLNKQINYASYLYNNKFGHFNQNHYKYNDGNKYGKNFNELTKRIKRVFFFNDSRTNQTKINTDLWITIKRRRNYLVDFAKTYYALYEQQKLTILSFVVYEDNYDTASKFLDTINKKFKRKNINKYGGIWVRDVGVINDKVHFHILLAIDYIDRNKFKLLFGKNISEEKYSVQFLRKSKYGMVNYLSKKNIFGRNKERGYSKSNEYKLPSLEIKLNFIYKGESKSVERLIRSLKTLENFSYSTKQTQILTPTTQTSSTCSNSPFHSLKVDLISSCCSDRGKLALVNNNSLSGLYLNFLPFGPPNWSA